MRILIFVLLLVAIAVAAYTPRKSAGSEKEKAMPVKRGKAALMSEENRETIEDESDLDEKSLDEIQEDAGVIKPTKKKNKTTSKKEKLRKEKTPSVTNVPFMSSFDFFAVERQQRIDKLKEKISKTPKEQREKIEQLKKELEEDEDEDFDNNMYEACDENANNSDDELCHCDLDEIDCSRIVFDSGESKLRTANLEIEKKNFIPYIANFSDNGIPRLQENKILFGFQKSISLLDFSHNEIRFIDANAFSGFSNLSKLNLANNNLQQIKKEWFAPIGKTLHRLDLSNNKIRQLSPKIFENLTNLKQLILDGNLIKEWKKEYFEGLNNLEELSLDNCKITELPGDLFEYLPKLTGVSLRSNPIVEIPRSLSNAKNLKNLDLSETNIAEIHENAFASDGILEEIIMEKLPYLSVIRNCAFCGLTKLKTLIISDNSKLFEIHPNAFGFIKSSGGQKSASIVELELQNSNLTTLSEFMLNYDMLTTFKIGGNPWNCTCETVFLMDSTRFTYKQDVSFPKCSYPEELKNRNLATLHDYEACERIRKVHQKGRLGTVLTLVLLVSFVIIGAWYMVTSGKLQRILRKVQSVPEVSYSNLTNRTEENLTLDHDFEARPAEV